jgi:predicted enzyme related to lactoylglutathione lyase
MGNPFVHVELMSTDINKSKAFYGSLFNWEMEDDQLPEMTYTFIKVGDGTGGGMLKNPMPGAPSSWMAYVLVEDVRAATAKAKTLGAKIMRDVTEVPDMDWFSIITDPTGAMLGLWEAKSR